MKLLTENRIPFWKRNVFIETGYRPVRPSFIYCLETLFSLHNETGNIATHLSGAVMMTVLWYYKLVCNSSDNYQTLDKLLFSGIFIAGIICFLMSAIFHTFQCYSKRVHKLLAKLDYFGISVVMMAVISVWFYYAFYYSPVSQRVYLTLFAIYWISVLVFSNFDKFSDPEYQVIRGFCFLAEGLYVLIPFLHYCYNALYFEPMAESQLFKSFSFILLSFISNLSGTLIYIYKIPECLRPGMFDLWFASHQNFHVLSIMAASFYYHGICLLADIRLNFPVEHKNHIK